ncbi:MAG: hypothetical protein WAT12_13370 [Candidatus Nitrotoga sp.]
MNILFFTSSVEDYLSDSVLHGFRTLFGSNCVDYPKCEILYAGCSKLITEQVRGKGFTLYTGLLDDSYVDRFHIEEKLRDRYFDLVLISDIWRQYGFFVQFRPWLTSSLVVILDGTDTVAPYPAAGHWWRRPYYWFLPRAHKRFLYFKREWTSETRFTPFSRLLPHRLRDKLPAASMLRKISFGIPESKIVSTPSVKAKDFPKHIVDAEVAGRIPGAATSYAFSTEAEYYADLQASRFGVTTRRSGWDCLRHYEIAANGAVPCFRDLEQKPETCAPHGLNETNCISYRSAEELFAKVRVLSDSQYANLQRGALEWVRTRTTKALAECILDEHRRYCNGL